MSDRTATRAGQRTRVAQPKVAARDWALVALLCVCALMSGVLEVLLVPLYIGGSLIPISVLVAVIVNFVLCTAGARLTGRTSGALLPMLLWVLPVLILPEVQPAGGDVLILGGTSAQQWVYYALILIGAGAGMVAIVRAVQPRPATSASSGDTTPKTGTNVSR